MTERTVEEQARGSSMPTNRTCDWCKKSGRDSRAPCFLWVRIFYGSFPVMTEECRIPGCNYADVIAVSIDKLKETTRELAQARRREAKLQWSSRRNLMGAFVATFALAILAVFVVLHF